MPIFPPIKWRKVNEYDAVAEVPGGWVLLSVAENGSGISTVFIPYGGGMAC